MDCVDQIKSKILLSSWIADKIKLTKKGHYFSGLCPFHSEKTPSFTVNDDRGFYHCFGCGAHGDIFQFVSDNEGLNFRESLGKLADFCGVELPSHDSDQQYSLFQLMEITTCWFGSQLHTNRRVLEYIKTRKISAAMVKKFQLGYAAKQGLQLYLSSKGFQESYLVTAKMIVKYSNRNVDFFQNRLIFPIYNQAGRVIAFGGRALAAEQQPKYLNSPESEIFKKKEHLYGLNLALKMARKQKQMIVVEGYFDVIALHQVGIENVVAPLGTTISISHLRNLWEVSPELVICMDGDVAGRMASLKLANLILPNLCAKHSVRFIALPHGQDPYDVAFNSGKEAMLSLIKDAKQLSAFLWSYEVSQFAQHQSISPEHYGILENNLQSYVNVIEDRILAKHYKDFFREQIRLFKRKASYNKGYLKTTAGLDVAKFHAVQSKAEENQQCTIIRIALEFPGLLDDPIFFEQFASLEITLPYAATLQRNMLDIVGSHSLTSVELYQNLEKAGFRREVEQLLIFTTGIAPILQDMSRAKNTWCNIMMLQELEMVKREELQAINDNNNYLAEQLQLRINILSEQLSQL